MRLLKKQSFQQKVFVVFFVIFTCFFLGVMFLQLTLEKNVKIDSFKKELSGYLQMINRFIDAKNIDVNDHSQHSKLLEIYEVFPYDLRITIIDLNGNMLFDSELKTDALTENYLNRDEIREAKKHDIGYSIRYLNSMKDDYFYAAQKFDNYFIRVAQPYNMNIALFLQSDNLFFYFMVVVFAAVLIILIIVSRQFGKTISGLRNFVYFVNQNNDDPIPDVAFPDSELGEIASIITSNYQQLKNLKDQLILEKEKMVQSFQNAEEGLGTFSKSFDPIFFNSRFLTYINMIFDENVAVTKSIFLINEFALIKAFLDQNSIENSEKFFSGKIIKNGKHFTVKSTLFYDGSFEVRIHDISQTEATRLMKQEITNNIAHELRTPVSSIRGYLETILENDNIDSQKQQYFIERSYQQTLKLSELIRDISLISKMEEAPYFFTEEEVNLLQILQDLEEEFAIAFKANASSFTKKHFHNNLVINGNHTLIYSIFRNLIENSINHAGIGVKIVVDLYDENDTHYFFSYYDTGKGIPDEHHIRLFDRFFRVNERSNSNSGSGLGLSIVKNAILFHHGDVVSKNHRGGGLEFLFTLRK